MNQAHTTYQSDFTFDWLQNNVVADMDEFCCSENVDECLKYISQEFSALGFPSIYSNSSNFESPVNCDIVKFLNATFNLLRSNSEFIQKNEDLETRNQQLCTDLNSLNKKNSILKSALEQNERKLSYVLERERQLKERNEQLIQQLKTEKEETKKLSAQLRQQKVAYQHEIRKYENNMNQIKAKVNQLLSDKNPNKKIATMTSSHILPRNSGQRGKWKTGVATTTAVEEMYNSAISAYETHSKELCAELNSFRKCLQSVIVEILEIVSEFQDEIDKNTVPTATHKLALNDMSKECWDVRSFEVKLKCILGFLKESTLYMVHRVNKNVEDQEANLKLNFSKEGKIPGDSDDSQQGINVCNIYSARNKEDNVKSLNEESIKLEKIKIEAEKLALSKAQDDIEKEKAELAGQKVALLRLAIQQKSPASSWHESVRTFPSVSVITSQCGSRTIPNLNQLKSSLSTPEQIGHRSYLSSSPLLTPEELLINDTIRYQISRSSIIAESEKSLSIPQSSAGIPLPAEIKFSNSDLPSWAVNRSESPHSFTDESQSATLEVAHVSSNEELLNESSNEEINLLRLKAAVEDIEKRRTTP